MAENELKAVSEIKFTEHYNRMWPFVKPYWIRALVGILLCIPIGALDSVVALALKPYMDLVLVDKTDRSPAYIPLLIVAFTTVQGFLNYAATYLNTWVGTKINQDLKRALFKKLLSLEIAFYDKNNSGYIMQRFSSDADMACTGLLDNLKVFISRLFSSLSLICVLIYNSWQLSIIAIVVLGCALLPSNDALSLSCSRMLPKPQRFLPITTKPIPVPRPYIHTICSRKFITNLTTPCAPSSN